MCEDSGRKEFLAGNGGQALSVMLRHEEFPVIAASAPIIIVSLLTMKIQYNLIIQHVKKKS